MIELRSDCARCHALCCVALPLTESADFPVTKPAGVACRNLDGASACSIHQRLRADGWRGCVTFECFGAGQHVTQVHYGGRSWRESPELAEEMFEVFVIQHRLHEMLIYLGQALANASVPGLREMRKEITDLCDADPVRVRGLDLAELRGRVGPLLRAASAATRRPVGPMRRAAQLLGADLRGKDLRRADLSGAYLIGASLAGADLRGADLLGTDLRAADLRGARLGETLFMVQSQANSAIGDASTELPHGIDRPAHWRAIGGPERSPDS